jgi:hypothetical protein
MFRLILALLLGSSLLGLNSSANAQGAPPQHPPRPKSLGPAKWNPTPQRFPQHTGPWSQGGTPSWKCVTISAIAI